MPHGGGDADCERCGTPTVAPMRPETAVPRTPPMQEQERLARLRQQDGRPPSRPPGLEALVSPAGRIDAWKLDEARLVWGATRAHLRSHPSDIAAAERLAFLTISLSNTLGASSDDLGLRALYEGALEVMASPRHRQLMRGCLARDAARLGALESARAWLAGCDPASDDLPSDSAYRVTRAYLSVARDEPEAALRVLGASDADVPIHDMMAPIAAVLRANALERAGDVDAARAQLARFMTSRSGLAGAVESVIESMPSRWRVCARSLQGARREHRRRLAKRAGGGARTGWVIVFAGSLPASFVLPGLIAGEVPGPMLIVLVIPLIFAIWGLGIVREARRQRLIAESGRQGQARVLALDSTGTKINHVPLMRVDVEVRLPGQAPFRASAKKLLHPRDALTLIGREVPICWHPKYPDEIVIDV
ncbi:hypothetical protein BE04_05330 [Sorangium cellulosum]|uniref:Uncharacterized protein n=2 Tax=Sorangium cellulosum TaxID=56 RepID=A0A150PEB9_SORCE|nr:hypothetical protein [Sorangium cellulosum]AGP36739.1 hypothetical protein SCE1572_20925 [Sorangium cellulosum So0157-2]KYF53996.1 hypothetical protein BE04_05330 [Sorangium cellulosum]